MSAYILRSIDPELWNSVKARATAEGRPLRFVILSLLQLYATGQVKLGEHAQNKTALDMSRCSL